jgi:hypothetical protein
MRLVEIRAINRFQEVYLEITVGSVAPAGIFSLKTLFLTVICRGTLVNLLYCTYSYWEPFFEQQILKNMVSQVLPEIIVRNEVPT